MAANRRGLRCTNDTAHLQSALVMEKLTKSDWSACAHHAWLEALHDLQPAGEKVCKRELEGTTYLMNRPRARGFAPLSVHTSYAARLLLVAHHARPACSSCTPSLTPSLRLVTQRT